MPRDAKGFLKKNEIHHMKLILPKNSSEGSFSGAYHFLIGIHRWGKVVPETGVETQKCPISPLFIFKQIRDCGGIEHFDFDKKSTISPLKSDLAT